MADKVFLCLFILCAIFSQGVVGTFLEDDTGKSLNALVREKRVINRIPEEDIPVSTGAFPFVVHIKLNKRIVGVGSILSQRTVITAARVVYLDVSQYTVTSGAIYMSYGVLHNVTSKEILMSRPHRSEVGIALIYVDPPFEHRHTGSIGLHSEPVLGGMHGVVLGWSSSLFGGRQESRCPGKLRAISVPILNHRECVNIYRGIFDIQDDNVCTYHPQRLCGHADGGAPLVINNELVGVYVGIIRTPSSITMKPDIFILLQHLQYNQWIRSHIRL